MTESFGESRQQAIHGKAVEDAAVAWVMKYERRNGRAPVDKRFERSFPGDLESPPRIIEIKATGTSYRGWFLPMEPVQVKAATSDPNFYVYVVENVGQGDPALFTLRILSGELLRTLTAKAVERRYFEVGWPTKVYDSVPAETMPADPGTTGVASHSSRRVSIDVSASGAAAPAPRTQAAAIQEAVRALGGEASIAQVDAWIAERYSSRWGPVGTAMADLTFPGSKSSTYPPQDRFLERVGPGRYRVRTQTSGDSTP